MPFIAALMVVFLYVVVYFVSVNEESYNSGSKFKREVDEISISGHALTQKIRLEG